MKNHQTNLWRQLISFENLLLAFRKAARGKRRRSGPANFERNLEEELLELQDELVSGCYQPGDYTSFIIHDPKKRLISAAPFRDRVVHHALCNIIEPIFERKFIYDTYANRIGKGTHKALERCTLFARRFSYVLPLDIKQYFPSIDHQNLFSVLVSTIIDQPVLDLCATILSGGEGIFDGEYEMTWFAGDDLLAANRKRGLPIGNLTSQFWANVYLNGLDHFVKRELKCKGYIRYVDDMLLFSNDKKELKDWLAHVKARLVDLRLSLHENNAQSRPCRAGIPFLGFQVFPDHRRLKRCKAVSARRRLKALAASYHAGRVNLQRVQAGILGWINHARFGDTWGLRKTVLNEVVL